MNTTGSTTKFGIAVGHSSEQTHTLHCNSLGQDMSPTPTDHGPCTAYAFDPREMVEQEIFDCCSFSLMVVFSEIFSFHVVCFQRLLLETIR